MPIDSKDTSIAVADTSSNGFNCATMLLLEHPASDRIPAYSRKLVRKRSNYRIAFRDTNEAILQARLALLGQNAVAFRGDITIHADRLPFRGVRTLSPLH